ncbi:MarR family transcriptional regulator [Acinetobacter baumannii]
MKSPYKNLDELRFASLVALVARTWRKTIDHRLEKYELTEATWLPLVYLSRLEKPVRQKDLAAMLALDSSSVVRVLNNLEKLGFIERTSEKNDRRAKATIITPKGKEIIEHLEGISTALENEIKASLNPDNFKVAREVLLNLFGILDQLNHLETERSV